MVLVPAGSFRMGCAPSDAKCNDDEQPGWQVQLDAFYIDETEVTVDAYGQCVTAGACSAPDEGKHCNWDSSSRAKRRNHPINCVQHGDAAAFCAWAGKRLPTEAEWEKAARGTDGRLYPWGNAPPSCRFAVMPAGVAGCGRQGTWPVGSKPAGASPFGALDMAGNVWEWVADRYEAKHSARLPPSTPRAPSNGSDRVIRGGGWLFAGAEFLRASNRNMAHHGSRSYYVGFRCAHSP